MEISEPKPSAADALRMLEKADKLIARCKRKHLPEEPHLLTLKAQEKHPRGTNIYEFRDTPFADDEVCLLSRSTLESHGDRGILMQKPLWDVDLSAETKKPAAGYGDSRPGTPAGTTGGPKKIYSFKAYQDAKKNGTKISPGGGKGESMSRGNSFEGVAAVNDARKARDSNGTRSLEVPATSSSRPAAAISRPAAASAQSATTNGVLSKTQPPTNKNTPVSKHSTLPPPSKLLPPRPQSPPRRHGNPNTKHNTQEGARPQKRPYEESSAPSRPKDTTRPGYEKSGVDKKTTSSPRLSAADGKLKPQSTTNKRPLAENEAPKSAEKRLKIAHTSGLQHSPSTKSPASTPTASSRPQSKTAQQLPKTKDGSSSKPSSQESIKLPRLLSPLPADLEGFESSQPVKSSNISSHNTPSKSFNGDTIVVKDGAKPETLDTPPDTSMSDREDTPFNLPPLLSPTLPPQIEQELSRLHEKGARKHVPLAQTFAERRQEGAKGVAQKKPKQRPNIGHPPKKEKVPKFSDDGDARSDYEASESSKKKPIRKSEHDGNGKVKLKYKKSKALDFLRILKCRPKPAAETTQWLMAELRKVTSTAKKEDDSDDEPPRAKAVKTSSASKKRPIAHHEQELTAPAPLDVAKSKTTLDPPFKSPATTTPIKKDHDRLLSTPKKLNHGETPKSMGAAMRKVPSSDSHALTPQASSSTPASAEKHRDRPISNSSETIPRSQAVDIEVAKYLGSLTTDGKGLLLKREMDICLKSKSRQLHLCTPTEVKRGLAKGVECLVAYISGFSLAAQNGALSTRRKAEQLESSLGLWEFVNRNAVTDSRSSPVLTNLTWQLGAVFGEELSRCYEEILPGMVKEGREREVPPLAEKLDRNRKHKERCWKEVQRGRSALERVGVKEMDLVMPWMRWREVDAYFLRVLGEFEKGEKVGWRALVL